MKTDFAKGLVLLTGLALSVPAAIGEEPKKPQQEGAQTIRIFRLEHAKSGSVQAILERFIPADGVTKFFLDERTNAIVAQGPPVAISQIAELIKLIDQEPLQRDVEEPTEIEMQIFSLKNRKLDDELQKFLSASVRNGSIEFDPGTQQVVVQGSVAACKLLERILKEIDLPKEAPRAAPASRRLRVAWLLQSEAEQLRPPPEDLKEIVDELASSGIGGIKLVAQPMISVMTNGTSFALDCSLDDPQAPIHLGIKGSLNERTPGIIQIQLSVEATRQRSESHPTKGPGSVLRTERLVSLSTVVETPAGHPVVLCVTPTGEHTSAFVVQAMP